MRITVKLGGSILEDEPIRGSIIEQIADLESEGHEIILVHGGGKSLSRRLEQLGMKSEFIEGLRVTDGETIRVALMVLAGEVNKLLVSEMLRAGATALGFSGVDAFSVRCQAVESPHGLGFVGKPVALNRRLFHLLLSDGIIPVVASLAAGNDARIYNVNADQMASICAWGTGCSSLIYLTDVPGVKDQSGTILKDLAKEDIERLRADGTIAGGMLPKTSSCLEALAHGVGSVYIVPGAAPDILGEIMAGTLKEGTRIHASK